MALLTSELRRIRYELGYNVLNVGADPYIGIHAIFEQVIATYMQGGATTTSATAVTASSTPAPVTLTLASGAGFASGDTVVIDVDTRQERVTAQSVSGTSLVVQLSNSHSGTYPVTVEGGESMVRDILGKLRALDDAFEDALSSAGLKSVGRSAVEWYGDSATSVSATISKLKMEHRDELASLLGVTNLWRLRRSGGLHSALY